MIQVIESYGRNAGYEKIAPTSATGFTAANLTEHGLPITAAVVSVKDNPVRVRMDGTDPTATEGLFVPADETIVIVGAANMSKFKCIDTATGASEVTALFFH